MPDDVEIRQIRESEYAPVGEITAQAYSEFVPLGTPGFAEYVARIADVAGRAGSATVLVAFVGGDVAGSATLELESRVSPGPAEPLDPDEAHLRMLGVSQEYRRRGIARRLVTACMDLARARGKRRISLDTSPAMTAAQRLYTSMGFIPTGENRTPGGVVLLGYVRGLESDAQQSR